MKHDVSTTLRRRLYGPGYQNSDMNAAELCQMLRAESDGPSTQPMSLSNASFVGL